MAMTRRGRFASTAGIVVIVAALVVGVLALTGKRSEEHTSELQSQ